MTPTDAPVRVYTDAGTIALEPRKHRCPPLDYHFSNLTPDAILAGHHAGDSPLTLVASPAEAEWFVLPLHWTCYLWNRKARMPEAAAMARLSEDHGKPLLVWFKGDLVPVVPFTNAIVFLPGMVASRAGANERACPVFVEGPASRLPVGALTWRRKRETPTVGFCGYARTGPLKVSWSILRGVQSRVAAALGMGDYRHTPVIPATLTRGRALRLLAAAPGIHCQFDILDRHFRSAPSDAFLNNITESDYTVCVRGYGNWSYRFYQTLACGRIPVFINTDCVLPNHAKIDWRRYCVWIDVTEVDQIAAKITEFHARLSPAAFLDLQRACRSLWEDQLTLAGFMRHLREYL